MKKILFPMFTFLAAFSGVMGLARADSAMNPIIHADVPDMSMIRVGDTYYMSSTTMHMSPGLPIMKSTDLVNWELVSYCYDTLADVDALNLDNGRSAYGAGSWASSIRYHNDTYYVSTFAGTTNRTYIYSTVDIENGPWEVRSFAPAYHDHTLYFDDDGRIYMIWGVGRLEIIELEPDLSGVKPGTRRVLIEDASAPAGDNMMLGSEGSQLFKVDGEYYLFNICWPRGGMRTVVIHRADEITGPYEGRLALQDRGIAQGGLIDTPEGDWYAYLFRDYGAVGRIPYLVPVTWEDGWPVLGTDGTVPDQLDLPASTGLEPGIVASDDFRRDDGEPALPLVWQWNHNPDNSLWSLTEREGFLRLKTGRVDDHFLEARNTLTQRTIGPVSTGATRVDVSNMKEGDFAGLALLQRRYGLVGVKYQDGEKAVVMVGVESDSPVEVERVVIEKDWIYLRAECDFRDRADTGGFHFGLDDSESGTNADEYLTDTGYFYYSLDGDNWIRIGSPLRMVYTLPHFMGYRFGLFNFATQTPGGYVDFDYFHISDRISDTQ